MRNQRNVWHRMIDVQCAQRNVCMKPTHSSRTWKSSPNAALLLLLPLMISSMSTPKLYTSAFLVSCPNKAYSGARYPLQEYEKTANK